MRELESFFCLRLEPTPFKIKWFITAVVLTTIQVVVSAIAGAPATIITTTTDRGHEHPQRFFSGARVILLMVGGGILPVGDVVGVVW